MTTPLLSDACNHLLQGERTAVQCYDSILRRFGTDPRIDPLRFIKAQHEASFQELELIVEPAGRIPAGGEGSWSTSKESADQVTSLFGDRSAMDFLLSGERSLNRGYENVFSDSIRRDPLFHSLISTVLLPRSQRHIVALERLKEMFGAKSRHAYAMDHSSIYPWAAAPAHWN